ncbi:MAG: 50S ribosomal protein L18 [Candidatus Melainabacteria bacterium]|nr:50S ribosomal protein L18 [Candidatus Melainabacteria bacterium]
MIQKPNRKEARVRRHRRIRSIVSGTSDRPRLCVYRSNKHIYAQVIDDTKAHTLVAASTLDKELQGKVGKPWTKEGAASVGVLLAERAKALGVNAVVFDRGGNIYHGRIAAVAEAARQAGLSF